VLEDNSPYYSIQTNWSLEKDFALIIMDRIVQIDAMDEELVFLVNVFAILDIQE